MTAVKKLVDNKLLKTLIPFGDLTEEQLAKLSGQFSVQTFEAGKVLFKQGDRDDQTHFLLTGQVNLRYGDGSVKNIMADTPQAQYALVPVRPRQATATAKSPITVLSLDADLFDQILSWGNETGFHVAELETHEDQNDWMTCFLQSKVFLRLPAQNIQALMMRLEEVKVKAGQVVIRQGDDDGYYYIIKSGRCRVTRKHSPKDKELELATLNVGEGFGEEAIITHNRRGASVTMLENGSLMRLSRNDFNRLLVEPLITAVSYAEVVKDPRAVFLDVRNYEDYARDGITGSKNITLTELRLKIDQLERSKQYVVCSNTGSRAAAAAFLLCQQGVDAVVLRYGLENLPTDVKRSNGDIENLDAIPVIDNVVSFNNKEIPPPKASEPPVVNNGKNVVKNEPPAPVTADEAMKDPRVKALFSQAQRRVQEENNRAKDADTARKKAQQEVNRLKQEAEQARRQLEEAKRQAEKAAKDSALAARLEAKKEAARLRELELGAKQAELEEAVRQSEEEANRAKNANDALLQAEQEIENLKKEMHAAVERAQEEAQKSAETIRQFLEQEAKRQKEEAARVAEKEAQRARQAEEAHRKAQQEIERLKADAQATKDRLREQAKLEADRARTQAEQARKQAEEEIERLRKEAELARLEAEEEAAKKHARALAAKQAEAEAAIQKAMNQARLEAQAEIEKLRQQAEKATDAEKAKKLAEAEIIKIKQQAEQERLRIEEQAIRIAEAARAEAVEEAWKITEAKQSEIEAVSQRAAEEARRALQAEEARRRAEQEIERLKQETESVRTQMQQQLSSEIERSEIEHEVAKARALELANKQAEIEEITKKSDEESSRALQAETARKKAEEEINNLKREMEALRTQQENLAKQQSSGDISHAERELARAQEKALAAKQEELQQISVKAAAESSAADEARKQAEIEIQRLRSEVEAATLQAQAQLQADAERAAAEQKAMQERSVELEKMQAMIAEAEHHAKQEAERAILAEQARRESEEQLARLKAAEEANVRAQEEIQRLKAEAGMAYYQAQEQAKLTAEEVRQKAELEIQKARTEEASRKQAELEQAARVARQEAQRAEQAEKARRLAEAEIKKLKAEAKLQRVKAEKAIRESLKSAREDENEKITQRAAEKVRKSMGNDSRKPVAAPSRQTPQEDPLGIVDLAQSQKGGGANSAANRRSTPAAGKPVDYAAVPEPAESYDFSKETANEGGNGFISDQLMWEAALGIREDKANVPTQEPTAPVAPPAQFTQPAVQATQPTARQEVPVQRYTNNNYTQQNTAQYHRGQSTANSVSAYGATPNEQAVFRTKEVNPYINTQDVTGILKNRKHVRTGGLFKYLMVILSLGIFAAAGYYFTLNSAQREQQREKIKNFISNEIPLPKAAEKTGTAVPGGDNSSSTTSQQTPEMGRATVEKTQRPLSMEERLELKREKAIKDIIQRKKTLERKVENQPTESITPQPSSAVMPSQAPPASTLPTLVDTDETNKRVDINVVNPLSQTDNTSAGTDVVNTQGGSAQDGAGADDAQLQGGESPAGIQLLPLNTEPADGAEPQ